MFAVIKSGKRVRNIKKRTEFMNSVYTEYNRYANRSGYRNAIESPEYLGGLAWANHEGEVMKLEPAKIFNRNRLRAVVQGRSPAPDEID